MESSFTDVEKRFVLAEMIKASHVDVRVLVNFIRTNDIQPDWFAMQLPGGRNLHQCLHAAETMFNVHLPPPSMPPLKRKSLGDLNEHLPKRQAVMSPVEAYAPLAARSLGMQTHTTQPVNIQPRPSPNGYSAPSSTSSPTVSASASPSVNLGRKRGRPSKADKEAWARQNASLTTSYPPITPAPIAPSPGSTIPARSYSPNSGMPGTYQIAAGNSSESKPKRKGRPSATGTPPTPDTVPRTVHGTGPTEQGGQAVIPAGPRPQERGVSAEERPHDGVERASGQAPTPVEPIVHPSPAVQQARSPLRHILMGPHNRETASPSIEQTQKENHAPVVNRA